jgi:hypothetical protein
MRITTDLVKKIFMLFIGQCCTIQAIKADLMFMIADYPSRMVGVTDIRNYNANQPLIAFKGFPVKIQAKGPWLDWTTKITLSALDGQSPSSFTVAKTGSGLVSTPYVAFTLNHSTAKGKYLVKMERPGGSDNFVVDIKEAPRITEIKLLTMTGAPAYLDAFRINTDIKVRIIGFNLSNLTLSGRSAFFPQAEKFTVVNQNASPNTATFKESVIKQTTPSDVGAPSYILAEFLKFTINNSTFEVVHYDNAGDVGEIFHVYDKPNLVLNEGMSNLYKKNKASNAITCLIGNETFKQILKPERCTTTFAVPAPTSTTPAVNKIVTVANPVVTITNNSYAPINLPIKVEFRAGNTVLQTSTIAVGANGYSMIAKDTKTVIFNRNESRKILYRSSSCPACYESEKAPYNWEDPIITVVVDPSNGTTTGPGIINEIDELDNSRTFAP